MSPMPLAVEEMIRWTTPVKEFMRTAQRDYTIRGVTIPAGEAVLLSYVSGNRDEEIFSDPFRFDIARDPNKHISFGYGVHFCLGAALARLEVSSFFGNPLPRLEIIEQTAKMALGIGEVILTHQLSVQPPQRQRFFGDP